MNLRIRRIAMMVVASAMLLAGCASTGAYGPGGGYGAPGQGYPDERYPERGYPPQQAGRLYGTVEGIDPSYGRIMLTVEDARSGRALRQDVRYDQRTRLFHQGRESAVEGLERGDVVSIDVDASGREAWARSIEVVRDVREGGYRAPGGGYGDGYGPGTDMRGQVAQVDTRARLIRLDASGYGRGLVVGYDGRTTVDYQGRRYRVEDLERGDLVRVQAREVGRDQWLAERIIVERSVGY